jgi:hypothetical protein
MLLRRLDRFSTWRDLQEGKLIGRNGPQLGSVFEEFGGCWRIPTGCLEVEEDPTPEWLRKMNHVVNGKLAKEQPGMMKTCSLGCIDDKRQQMCAMTPAS